MLTLRISDERFGRVKIALENVDTKGLQLQTHPNVDKELFKQRSHIGLKNPTKPFPLNNDVGVLKWRWQTQDESAIPLTSEYNERIMLKRIRFNDFCVLCSQLLAIGERRRRMRREH